MACVFLLRVSAENLNPEVKEEQPYGDYKNRQILSIKNFMSERVIFNLTFLCHRFRLFRAVKIFSEVLFNTLPCFDVEFSWKDCVTSIKHIFNVCKFSVP